MKRLSLILFTVLATLVASVSPAAASAPLVTALFGPAFGEAGDELTLRRTRQAGATAVRLILNWEDVAPRARPVGFDAANPADPAYSWAAFDRQIVTAVEGGLDPIVTVMGAPAWAQEGPQQNSVPVKPYAKDLALFARAAASRYKGDFKGLPRVRNWLLWNEPNLVFFLRPQFESGRAVSPTIYRGLLNAFADAVHAVRADNVVVAGATAPFTSADGKTSKWGVAPLAFMRSLLCLDRNLRPACPGRAKFDVWAHHPYTSGGPSHSATFPDDVSLGDLPAMKKVLDAGRRHRKIVSSRPVRFWVTEFSWDTSPPDPKGVPVGLQARWVAEALHTMWRNGVSLVTWFSLLDSPIRTSPYQSGLYYADGRPKPARAAFRFPFVALGEGSRARLWGRTPTSTGGTVVIERRGSGWETFAVIRADRNGIFNATRPFRSGVYRARFGREASRSFSTTPVPDRFYRPFGTVG